MQGMMWRAVNPDGTDVRIFNPCRLLAAVCDSFVGRYFVSPYGFDGV